MTPHSTEAALLAGCAERPGDFTARLVLADWLEEYATTVPCPKCGGGKKVLLSSEGHGRRGRSVFGHCKACKTGNVPDGRALAAEAWRWLAEKRRVPHRHEYDPATDPPEFETNPWRWMRDNCVGFTEPVEMEMPDAMTAAVDRLFPAGYYRAHDVPLVVFPLGGWFFWSPTVAAAFDAVVRVWAKLSAAERTECWKWEAPI